MEAMLLRYRSRLESMLWFRGLPMELRDHLMNRATVLRLDKGQALYRRGDPPRGMYAVLEGAVSLGTAGVDGKESLQAVLGPTTWLGEVSFFDGLPRAHNAIAVSRLLVLYVSEGELRPLLDMKPHYWRDFALLMAQRLRAWYKAAEAATLLSGAQRVACRLLLIAEGYEGLNPAQRTIRLSQDCLASMASLSRQSTNHLLKDLENQRIVKLKFGEIAILDIERLRAASLGDFGQ